MLFELELDFVWNCLARLGVHHTHLEDAVNDVFLALHEHMESYDSERPLRPWIFAFVFRVAAEYRRKQVRDAKSSELYEMPGAGPTPEADALTQESLQLVHTALECLDLDKRAVFVLHELEDMAAPEIAAALEVPLNTVYSRLRLGRAEFEKALKRLRLTGVPLRKAGEEAT